LDACEFRLHFQKGIRFLWNGITQLNMHDRIL
jgi:hypothetical protein